MPKTLRDMPMIGCRQERGYLVLHITGVIDGGIYAEHQGEESFLTHLGSYISKTDKPFALDVTECVVHGTDAMGLFVEAYKMRKTRFPVIHNNDHLVEALKRTGINEIVDLYRKIEELPDLPPISSQ